MSNEQSYFVRTGPETFLATKHVSGAWKLEEQHIAAALGLMAHLVETDRDRRRGGDVRLARVSYDILGVVPVEEVGVSVRLLRPGRTIELVEARMSHGGRDIVLLRAWLMAPGDTEAIAGTALEAIPGPDEMEPWSPSDFWGGGFIASIELRRRLIEPGRGIFWARTDLPLIDERFSRTAGALGLVDIANGMSVRADPREVAFPNIDLTAHLFREPDEGWLGFDTRVSFGPGGRGLTSTVLHDATGPFGTVNQILTVRP